MSSRLNYRFTSGKVPDKERTEADSRRQRNIHRGSFEDDDRTSAARYHASGKCWDINKVTNQNILRP